MELYTLCLCSICLLLFATDALWTRFNCWRLHTLLCAVGKEHAELKGWLPRPPVAFIILETELVTAYIVLSHFEVNGVLLKWKC